MAGKLLKRLDEKIVVPVPYGAEVQGGGVRFWVGSQAFRLAYEGDGEHELAWMRDQLQHALDMLAKRGG